MLAFITTDKTITVLLNSLYYPLTKKICLILPILVNYGLIASLIFIIFSIS